MAAAPRKKKVTACGACLGPVVITFMVVVSALSWLHTKRMSKDADRRVRELETLVTPELRAMTVLTREAACLMAEQRLYTRGPFVSFEVDCDDARLELKPGGAARLGPVYSLDTPAEAPAEITLCFAPTDEGWQIVGPAWRLSDCAFQIVPEGTLEQQRASAGSWRPTNWSFL